MFVLFKADACLEIPFTDSCNNKNENIFLVDSYDGKFYKCLICGSKLKRSLILST